MRNSHLYFASSALALVVGFAPHAVSAQTSTEAQDAVEEVVVTGSRIRRVDTTTAEPVGVISAEVVKDRGFINASDAVNNLPQISGSQTTRPGRQSQGAAAGRDFVSLFNLGSQRTLTLVNGRRFVGSNPAGAGAGGNQVDINNIPTGLIERIETVQASGAAVYGSDAIAGVVNVILKKKFVGFEFDAQVGISDLGDYPRDMARITAGQDFAEGRGNVAVNLEYTKTDSLRANARKATDISYTYATNPANTSNRDGISNLFLLPNWRVPEVSDNGLVFRNTGSSLTNLVRVNGQPVQFSPGGALVPYNIGNFYGVTTADGSSDGANFADHYTLLTGSERFNATVIGHYDLTDNVRVSTELFASLLTGEEPVNQQLLNSNHVTGLTGGTTLHLENPFLRPEARAALASAGITDTFVLSRWHNEFDSSVDSYGETYRALIALDGDFNFADRDFYWNAAASQGLSKGHTESSDIYQQRWLNAVDVVNGPTGPICRVTRDNPNSTDPNIRGCVPMNLFGMGAPSQEAINFVLLRYRTEFETKQTNLQANIGGDLAPLPAGNLSFVAGWEYRKEQSDYNPDPRAMAGIGRQVTGIPIQGEYDTQEFYGEAVAPLLGGDFTPIPFVTHAEVTGAYRTVDNSLAGENEAWSYGGRVTLVDQFTIRGTKSKTFRAPSLYELFLPKSTGQGSSLPDPCDVGNIASGNVPLIRQANCAKAFQAVGLPANYQLSSDQRTLRDIVTGGNPDLKNEIADSWTLGFVFQPHAVPGLTIVADWVRINVSDAITNFNLPAVLQACYDSPGESPFCSAFSRNAQGNVNPGAITGYSNAGRLQYEGETYAVEYDLPLDVVLPDFNDPGRLNLALNVLHTTRQNSSASGLVFDEIRSAGTVTAPEWETQFNARYTRGPLRLNWNVQYTSPTRVNSTDTYEQRDVIQYDAYMQHDVSAQYQFTDRMTGRVIVQNLFNAQPPYGTSAVGDIIGRYYYVGFNYKF